MVYFFIVSNAIENTIIDFYKINVVLHAQCVPVIKQCNGKCNSGLHFPIFLEFKPIIE
jgi:hypothetical protein